MESSSFGNGNNNSFVFSDIKPIFTNGATSDTFKVLIYGKWHFLKRPKKEYKNNSKYLAAFQKEFEIGYTLDHPNIVKYVVKGEDENGFYILLEYIDGFTLTDLLKSNHKYFTDYKHIDKLLNQLLSALKYIHERQTLHLDLKPDNLLITGINNDLKLIDFGFSYTDCFSSHSIGRTELFAAPEQLSGSVIDQRTDVYGFGKILEYILKESPIKKPLRIYRKLLKKCLALDMEDRFNNVNEITDFLSTQHKIKKRKSYAVILAGVILGIGLAIVFSNSRIDQSNNIYPYENVKTVFDGSKMPLIVDSASSETLKNRNNTIKGNQSRDFAISQTEDLQREIKDRVSSNFVELYESFDEINNENYLEIQKVYSEAVNKSLRLIDTLHVKYKTISKEEISGITRNELNLKTSIYLTWLSSYDAKQRAH